MKFLFNTKQDSSKSMATKICIEELSQILINKDFDVTKNDWDNYDIYDVVIFMPYDADIKNAKKQNENIKVGIADPKLTNEKEKKVAVEADFLLVSSIEQYDKFLTYNNNIYIYYMFPEITLNLKKHEYKQKIILGYHGNKIHLHCAYPHLTLALDNLAEKYDIEFWAIYNIEMLGMWSYGLPKNIKVKHIQWTETIYEEIFDKIDIGIVPNLISNHFQDTVFTPKQLFLKDKEDYILQYKYSSNPGRQYVFAMKGIPIVSEMYPSSSQFIFHGKSGELVSSAEGWYHSINKLILSSKLRTEYANEMSNNIKEYSRKDNIVLDLVSFIEELEVNQHKSMLTQYSYYNVYSASFINFINRINNKIKRIIS